jgi:nucleoside-diphosphate-sugar epimerase
VNVASGQGTPILDLARRVIEVCSTQSRIEMLPAREQEVVGFVADVGRMRSELHLEPPTEPLAYLSLMQARRLQVVL